MSKSLAENEKREPPRALMNMRDHNRRAELMTDWAQERDDIKRLIARYPKREKEMVAHIFASFRREIRNRDDLIGKDERSAWDALSDALAFKFLIGGPNGHADLVPYGNQITLQPNYRGHMKMIMEHGGVVRIDVGEKRTGDFFDFQLGDEQKLVHKPAFSRRRDRAAIELVYCILTFEDGSKKYEVWTAEDIDSHKVQYSKLWNKAEKGGKKNSAWHTAWLRMAYKTVIIAAGKYVPKTPMMKKLFKQESDQDLLVSKIIDAVSVQPAQPAPAAPPAIEQEPAIDPPQTLTRPDPGELTEPEQTVDEADDQTVETPQEWKPDEAAETRINNFAIQLQTLLDDDKTNLTDVDKALTTAGEDFMSDQEELLMRGMAEEAKNKIRSKRGPGSKRSGKQQKSLT